MGGWTSLAIAGLVQLVWRHPLSGIAARAIAVPGMLFTALCLATGSIWGKPTWGTWWEWDGRMTSMLVLLFLYAGFVALTMGDANGNGGQRQGGMLSRGAAVYALVGAVNIPIINRRSEEHTSELQSLMRISYAVFCLQKKKNIQTTHIEH